MTYKYEDYEEPERITIWVVNNGCRNIKSFKAHEIEEAVTCMLASKEQGLIEQLRAYARSPYDHWKYEHKEPSVRPHRMTVTEYNKMFNEGDGK